MKAKWSEKKKTLEADPSFKGIFDKLTEESKAKISVEGLKPEEIENQLKDLTQDLTEVSVIRLLFEQMKKDLPKDEFCLAQTKSKIFDQCFAQTKDDKVTPE